VTIALIFLVAAGAVGAVLLAAHLRRRPHRIRKIWPVHAVLVSVGTVAFTLALIAEGARRGWVIIAYVMVLTAGILGVVVSGSKGSRIPTALVVTHAAVGAVAIGILALLNT